MNSPTDAEPRAIWVFTPSRTDPKDLEAILVQRQELLKDAVERVRESALTAHKHHQLFVGPRGCGKTHLVTLIVSRLSADAALVDRLRIAWLNEDEPCTTLLDFLLKVHAALEKRYPGEFRDEALAPAYKMKPAAALKWISEYLLAALGQKTLLGVAENLDALFESIGDAGQKQLRAFIQENPRIAMVATAQRLVDEIADRASPFFGFFQTEHLKPLSLGEAVDLLQNIARLQKKNEVVEFLGTNRGKARVRALHHLSGGNHRVYIVLSQFITRDSIDALVGPFMKMVDELTPYYQERIRWLSPLQRKIVEFLCTHETTAPVKEIARRLFATSQTISSQLQDLRRRGYVEANVSGRESRYEISEPLMRLCVEVKENASRQPLRLLVDFLRVWYDDRELRLRLTGLGERSIARAYVEAAIDRNRLTGNLRKKILLGEILAFFPDSPDRLRDQPLSVVQAIASWQKGKLQNALDCITEAIGEEESPTILGFLHFIRAQLYAAEEQIEKEIGEYSALLSLKGVPDDMRATALLARSMVQFRWDRSDLALADFDAIEELTNPPREVVSTARMAKAGILVARGQWREGMNSLQVGLTARFSEELLASFIAIPISVLFVTFEEGSARSELGELFELAMQRQILPHVASILIHHIGAVYRDGPPFPDPMKLEAWADAWATLAQKAPELALPVRLLRIAAKIMRSDGKDRSALLELPASERTIVEQSFGFADTQLGASAASA